jgi:hemolysin activation/secretion protein
VSKSQCAEMRYSNLGCLVGLAVSLSPALAFGQAYERVAPKALPEKPPAIAPLPPEASPVPTSDQVVLPALKGLVFIPDPAVLHKEGLPDATGISAPGLPLLNEPDFTAKISPFIGQKLTLGDIDKIAGLVTDWYKEHDNPFISVTVPPQNITAGVIQVVVTQYRIGTVKAEGNDWFASDLLTRESGLESGQTLTLTGVQEGLDRLNSNPFRTVNTVFQPGADPGQTDVTLKTEDRLPLHLYASFDNAGTANLGRPEWSVGAGWGNLFGLDQQIAYQFTRSFSARFNAHSINWSAPLPWNDKLVIFGSYEEERPDAGPRFDETGKSGQADLRYVHPLPSLTLAQGVGLTEDIQVGYDFKTTNNNLEFGGLRVFAHEVEVDQFPIIYDATETDTYGGTVLSNQFVFSPGGMTDGNNSAAFRAALAHSSADYVYDRVTLTRTTMLPAKFSWVARVTGQVADGNLQSSEQLTDGGPGSVRGYYTDTAIGSEGVLVSQEILTPAVSLAKLLNQQLPVEDQAQFGVFWDYGHVSQVEAVPDQVNSAALSSVGVDLHLTLDRYLDVRFDTGWQLRAAPGAHDRSVFSDIAITAGF